MDLKNVARFAMRNRRDVEAAGKGGCYSCLLLFPAQEITDYTDGDETVLCPKCGLDTVLADGAEPLSQTFLGEAKNYWFGSPP